MSERTRSTRRKFFAGAGAALAAPLAVAVSPASRGEKRTDLSERIEELEDFNAIRELQLDFLRLINACEHGQARALFAEPELAEFDDTIVKLSADDGGRNGVIDISADGMRATASFDCAVETEAAIEAKDTLIDMARAQGEGVLRGSERRVFEAAYIKRNGTWKIERLRIAERAPV